MDSTGRSVSVLRLSFLSVLFVFFCPHSKCVSGQTTLPQNIWTHSDGCKDGNETHCSECQPSAPFALAIGTHNITLSWKSLDQSDVVYMPQWTGPSLSGVWTYKENTTAPPFTVNKLQPYSWYKFRIWVVVCQQLISSPESTLYQTQPYGAPASAPVLESVESVSSDSVELSWSPPVHPQGPLVGYNINLTSHEDTISMTTGGDVLTATIFPSTPNTTYSVSLAAVNREGQGPAAQTTVTTPERDEQRGYRWMIVSRLKSLRKKEADDFYLPADCLSDALIEFNITGVSIHQSSGQLYFSEGVHIWSKLAGNLSNPSDLRLLHSSTQEVTGLCVDWLNEKLYYISGGKVFRCGLENCSDPVHLQLSSPGFPTRIKADPYNGWLFLLFHDGIYRAVLPKLAGEASLNTGLVIHSTSLHDFVVSVQSRKLLYFQKEIHSLSTASLDGSVPAILLSDIKVVDTVRSLAYEDSQVMLTDGLQLWQQVSLDGLVRFNQYLMDCAFSQPPHGGFDNLLYSSPSSQPYPVPRKPTDLTALFGSRRANLRWREPQLRMGASPSAWQNWTYTVTASTSGSVVRTYSNITTTQMEVTDLQSSRRYTLSLRAKSPGGQSSSVLFEGTTLQNESNIPYIVAASNNGLWKQELDGYDFTESLAYNVTAVRDMDWYNDMVYWVDGSGHISFLELKDGMTGLNATAVPGAVNAEVVAFDWLGTHLYWSCNSTQICRGRPTSPEQEVVVRSGRVVTGLVVDALRAFVYWSSDRSVESARLNGQGRVTIQGLGLLSGQQVVGMTLDLTEGSLFWLVQDGLMLHLHRTDLLKHRFHGPVLDTPRWSSSMVSGPGLAFYSGRLLWLDRDQRLWLQELNQTQSVLLSPAHTLTAFTLIQSTLKPLPVCRFTAARTDQDKRNSMEGFCPPSNTLTEPVLEVRHFSPNTQFSLAITPYTYWGNGVTTSTILRSPGTESSTEIDAVVIAFGVLTGVLLVVIITAVFIWHRRRAGRKSTLCPDEELEEIRGLVGMGNACYAVRTLPIHCDIGPLPVFPRDQLKLQRLLGSGAFGEVYEGIATGIPSVDLKLDTRVAVKTLQQGATDEEKTDFLKEAHLMSQFSHPNILRLLGVCLLNEPQYLILELMEGGDLRSYLMGARPAPDHGPLLNLGDLMDICLDVAKGCAYLEKMHFVHRDLAARNCLVSLQGYTDPERVVKIGDFGLSRDVYKKDYYRKRGEGLLPVRWMPPESLTDGMFNKYSDVWAFGVLLWEVVSLGKQPYPALTNLEVMHHINSGGRLPAPADCPKSLYALMLACWSKTPSDRPNFRCLEERISQLRQLGDQLREEQDGSKGIVNYGFQDDEECKGVDKDESPGDGLTQVVSAEGLNYLMFTANDRESEPASPSGGQETPNYPLPSTSGGEAAMTTPQDTTESKDEEAIKYLVLSAKDLMETSIQTLSVEDSSGEGPCLTADSSGTEKAITEHSSPRNEGVDYGFLMFSATETQTTDENPSKTTHFKADHD
ncbi:LOW QUALITY PROTEIN: proto-oncogene tyrosine-protein kinase ROS [Alosa alosa]|uniref:LOW QUALITY PROTEIN: proto-oncogene tyrosine-protein kinase ROS n=1 Tax=Alosa alosa TaxID=278164 RepID=UPI002015517E|nr:LOW QUALITY PROTEIN: proto-oncogene tyrosine-protein kinase ROS [Alosa alosa]